MKTYENFNEKNNNHIKYLCGCNEDIEQCPVCLDEAEEINIDIDGDNYTYNYQCSKCNFEWKKYIELEFIQSYDNKWDEINKGETIPDFYRIDSDRYLNDGNDVCPFCGSEDDAYAEESRREDDNGTDEMECSKCNSTWNKELVSKNPICIDLDAQNIIEDKLFKNKRNKYTPLHFKKLVQMNKQAAIDKNLKKYKI